MKLNFGDVLHEPGQKMRYVYFPNDSLVSLLTLVDDRSALEVGLVGHEGMVGMPLTLGATDSAVRALVQGAGTAHRMNATRFLREFSQRPGLRRELNQYLNTMMIQIQQTAACNLFHDVEARLARWLLMTRDRVRSEEFRLTHVFLSHMLGVRRVGVTVAASVLQRKKLIEYSRGNIKILDHAGLEAAACSCYKRMNEINGRVRSAAVSGRA